MIGRGFVRAKAAEEQDARGFDAFELRLGDIMRGERATLGKTLVDVQRELKIKAAYIAAIEGADPSAFDTPGFIAGYVRSYARYLNMDPDWAFDIFCRESGFETAHGMSAAASSAPPRREARTPPGGPMGASRGPHGGAPVRDIFAQPAFAPGRAAVLSGLEPRAVGSVLVLAALLGGLSYGGWAVLREVQKVTMAPVEQPPSVVAEVDPLAGNAGAAAGPGDMAALDLPSPEALDRLYRPEALDVPVLVPRDGPIAAIDPRADGATPFAPAGDGVELALAPATPPALAGEAAAEADGAGAAGPIGPMPAGARPGEVRVTAGPAPEVQLLAVREAWVRITAADGATLFEGIMGPGDRFDVPATEEAPTLRAGESGALYMAVGGVAYGPVGAPGAVTSNVALAPEAITAGYALADLADDRDLADYVAVASAETAVAPAAAPPAAD